MGGLFKVGTSLSRLETPVAIVDSGALQRNMQRMKKLAKNHGVRLRPHFKCHKASDFALMQLALGAVGICCQTVGEAEVAAAAGVPDILITNQVVHPAKLERLAVLAAESGIGLCFDDSKQVDAASAAARAAGTAIHAYIELEVGGNRCGVQDMEQALALAAHISRSDGLHLRGLQAYNGRAQHLRTHAERSQAAADVADRANAIRSRIIQADLECQVITGGGTGTCFEDAEIGVLSELQPGSYLFMDGDYGLNVSSLVDPFEQSLFVLATVISARPELAVIDAGLKSLAFDSGVPKIFNNDQLQFRGASDEHGVIIPLSGTNPLRLGEQIKLIPGHCDPTINLHDMIVLVEGDRIGRIIKIDARGPR